MPWRHCGAEDARRCLQIPSREDGQGAQASWGRQILHPQAGGVQSGLEVCRMRREMAGQALQLNELTRLDRLGRQPFAGLKLRHHGREEGRLRTLLVQLVSLSPLALHELETVVGRDGNHVVLSAVVSSAEREDHQVEQLVGRMGVEKNVAGASWQLLPHHKAD